MWHLGTNFLVNLCSPTNFSNNPNISQKRTFPSTNYFVVLFFKKHWQSPTSFAKNKRTMPIFITNFESKHKLSFLGEAGLSTISFFCLTLFYDSILSQKTHRLWASCSELAWHGNLSQYAKLANPRNRFEFVNAEKQKQQTDVQFPSATKCVEFIAFIHFVFHYVVLVFQPSSIFPSLQALCRILQEIEFNFCVSFVFQNANETTRKFFLTQIISFNNAHCSENGYHYRMILWNQLSPDGQFHSVHETTKLSTRWTQWIVAALHVVISSKHFNHTGYRDLFLILQIIRLHQIIKLFLLYQKVFWLRLREEHLWRWCWKHFSHSNAQTISSVQITCLDSHSNNLLGKMLQYCVEKHFRKLLFLIYWWPQMEKQQLVICMNAFNKQPRTQVFGFHIVQEKQKWNVLWFFHFRYLGFQWND